MDYLGSLFGVLASALLATVALNLPLLLAGAITAALGAALVFFMRELNFRPAPRDARASWAQVGATARGGARLVRGRPVLLILLAVAAFSGMSSEGFDRLWEAHLLQDVGLPRLGGLDPVVWFGVINAGALVLGYLAAEVIGRRLDVGSVAVASRALFILDALTIAGVLAFALAGSFGLALVAFWLAGIARRLGEPMYLAWLNQGLQPGVKATVISIGSQSNALGQVAGGPVVGAVGTLAGIRAALTLSPALLLYARAIRRGGVERPFESPNDPRESNRRY
jgi:hypothetical protein